MAQPGPNAVVIEGADEEAIELCDGLVLFELLPDEPLLLQAAIETAARLAAATAEIRVQRLVSTGGSPSG
jgi:hypothetical protein